MDEGKESKACEAASQEKTALKPGVVAGTWRTVQARLRSFGSFGDEAKKLQ